jgi:hypothetical protein
MHPRVAGLTETLKSVYSNITPCEGQKWQGTHGAALPGLLHKTYASQESVYVCVCVCVCVCMFRAWRSLPGCILYKTYDSPLYVCVRACACVCVLVSASVTRLSASVARSGVELREIQSV